MTWGGRARVCGLVCVCVACGMCDSGLWCVHVCVVSVYVSGVCMCGRCVFV